MKKNILLFILFIAQINFAQNTFPPNGNVGIGTLSPTSKLDVLGTIKSFETTPLGSPLNSSQLINEICGNCGANRLYNRSWLLRDNALSADWSTARLHDGISVDVSFQVPQNNTRTWWERDPWDNIQAWGDGANTYFTINSGKIGIGTALPESKLSIYSTYADGWNSGIELNREDGGKGWIVVDSEGMKLRTPIDGDGFYFRDNDNNTSLMIADGGNVGIGISNPAVKLEVVGNETTSFEAAGFYNVKNYGNANDKSETRINLGKIEGSNRQAMGAIGAFPTNNTDSSNGILAFYTREGQSVLERLRVVANGNIGIGTKNPLNKLDVNGTIHSKEVKVDMNGWSDFVFKKDYTLPTLQEVEKHISEKGHLENIPSEEEVLKNGINLGEMNSKLLQKIEELTLYVIEQNKKLQNQEKEIIKLNEDNADLVEIRKRLNKIESKL
ncbi:hypothetical protein [Flavobacterium mesophilum]|uniref:hypothetical protein n=1 Tax=Flavobacterium mesophilum TaxID=3143495 RepID=UPI0031D0ED05